jgi:hypothetical protein
MQQKTGHTTSAASNTKMGNTFEISRQVRICKPIKLSLTVPMFANLLQLITRRAPTSDYDHAFVKEVRITPPREVRSRRAERWIVAGWILILAKCAAMWWLIQTYQVPIHPLWLIGPTVVFGLLATAIYIWRD